MSQVEIRPRLLDAPLLPTLSRLATVSLLLVAALSTSCALDGLEKERATERSQSLNSSSTRGSGGASYCITPPSERDPQVGRRSTPDVRNACAVEAVEAGREYLENIQDQCGAPMAPTALGGRVDYSVKGGGAVAVANYVSYFLTHFTTDLCHHKKPYFVAYKTFAECLNDHPDWTAGCRMSWTSFKKASCPGDWELPTMRGGPAGGRGHDWCEPNDAQNFVSPDDCVLWERISKTYSGSKNNVEIP